MAKALTTNKGFDKMFDALLQQINDGSKEVKLVTGKKNKDSATTITHDVKNTDDLKNALTEALKNPNVYHVINAKDFKI